MAIIKWLDDVLWNWGGWQRHADNERLGYQESVLGRLLKNGGFVDHSATRIGLPIQWTERDSQMLDISKAVAQLTTKQRTTVFLHYVSRMPWDAIARTARCDERTARRRLEAAHLVLSCRLEVIHSRAA